METPKDKCYLCNGLFMPDDLYELEPMDKFFCIECLKKLQYILGKKTNGKK